jgi:hypothetical protein
MRQRQNKVVEFIKKLLTTNRDLRDVHEGAARVNEAQARVEETLRLIELRKDAMRHGLRRHPE